MPTVPASTLARRLRLAAEAAASPCCPHHDRLGDIQISVEYTSGSCGSVRLELTQAPLPGVSISAPMRITNPDHASPNAEPYFDPGDPHHPLLGYGKPAYCCGDCPTLVAKHRAQFQQE